MPTACRNINLKCHATGFNRIHAKYENEDISVKKNVLIGCYRKLKVCIVIVILKGTA